jgi:putative ABC transport system permease protein
VALGVLTFSLKTSATSILSLGQADLTVAQKGGNIFDSSVTGDQVKKMTTVPGVTEATGVLLFLDKLDSNHTQQIHIGIKAEDLGPFGVKIDPGGRPFTDGEHDGIIIGEKLAQSLHKKPGDTLTLFVDQQAKRAYRIDGVFTVPGVTDYARGIAENAVMMPLAQLQDVTQRGNVVTLVFMKISGSSSVGSVQKKVNKEFPGLAAITGAADFGIVDRNLQLVSAANTGGTILAALIAVAGVLTTSLLSFFERTREFGVMRSIGWSRKRVLGMVMCESLLVSVVGAAFGVLLGWGAVNVLQNLGSLEGLFVPLYTASVFGRGLVFAVVVAFLGALYPALRAAFLSPLEALRRE